MISHVNHVNQNAVQMYTTKIMKTYTPREIDKMEEVSVQVNNISWI